MGAFAMLGCTRRFWILTTAALIGAGGVASPVFALPGQGQGTAGLNTRLDEAEAKLADDIKACRPIKADDYQPLVDEMRRNLSAGRKAINAGVPVDVDKLLSDSDRATNLMERAKAAQMTQSNACPPKQAQTQPQTSTPTTGVSPTPRPSEPGVSKNDEQEIARQQRTIDEFESALTELEGLVKAGKCKEAWDLADDLDDWLDELDNPDPKRPAAFGGPTPKVPPRLIDQWDDRIDDLLKKCPQPGKFNFGMIAPILDTHNAERAQYGYGPLRWSLKLSDHAQEYAKELARTGQLVHASREGRGNERENLQQGLPGWSTQRRIEEWLKEKKNFVPGDFPNVARDGNLNSVLHYTQIIWPDTKAIGCGMTLSGGFDWFVCRYSPGGNKDGKPVGMPITIASNPSNSLDGSRFQTTGKIDHDFKYGFSYRNTPISSQTAWDGGVYFDSEAPPGLTNMGVISVLPTPAGASTGIPDFSEDPIPIVGDSQDSYDWDVANFFIFDPGRPFTLPPK